MARGTSASLGWSGPNIHAAINMALDVASDRKFQRRYTTGGRTRRRPYMVHVYGEHPTTRHLYDELRELACHDVLGRRERTAEATHGTGASYTISYATAGGWT